MVGADDGCGEGGVGAAPKVINGAPKTATAVNRDATVRHPGDPIPPTVNMAALRAIAAGDRKALSSVSRPAPQPEPPDRDSVGTPVPTCVGCETPLEEGLGKMAGKFACGDEACGMFGKEQKGKR